MPRKTQRKKLTLKSKEPEIGNSYYFMLNCLLHSRVHTGLESDREVYDEDVNVYLAGLLNAIIDPIYLERISKFLEPTDMDVRTRIERATSIREQYEIYKTNADAILIEVAVFGRERTQKVGKNRIQLTEEDLISRASLYYALASNYMKRLQKGSNSVSRTLARLSTGIEDYVEILSYMGNQYLNMFHPISEGEIFHINRQIDEIQKEERRKKMEDELLDAYSAFLKTRTDESRENLSKKIQLINQEFPGRYSGLEAPKEGVLTEIVYKKS